MFGITQKDIDSLWDRIKSGEIKPRKIRFDELPYEHGIYFMHKEYSELSICFSSTSNEVFESFDLLEGMVQMQPSNDTIVFVLSEKTVVEHLILNVKRPLQSSMQKTEKLSDSKVLFL